MNQTTVSPEAINAAYRRFSNSLSPNLKQSMNGRLERGLEIVLSGGVVPSGTVNQRLFKVKSSDPGKQPYLVDLFARTCTCPDHWKGHYCKHRVAAQVFKLAFAPQPSHRDSTPAPSGQNAETQRPTIIWAYLRLNGKNIGVEVLGIENDMVRVQALPIVKENGRLEPQFPFPNGHCSQLVQVNDLEHIRIYRDA